MSERTEENKNYLINIPRVALAADWNFMKRQGHHRDGLLVNA